MMMWMICSPWILSSLSFHPHSCPPSGSSRQSPSIGWFFISLEIFWQRIISRDWSLVTGHWRCARWKYSETGWFVLQCACSLQWSNDYFHLVRDLSGQMHEHKPCKSFDDTVTCFVQQSAVIIGRDTITNTDTIKNNHLISSAGIHPSSSLLNALQIKVKMSANISWMPNNMLKSAIE